jgi:hypothetical protein
VLRADLGSGGSDVSRFRALTFRTGVNFNDPRNPPGEMQNFAVALMDTDGHSSRAVPTASFGYALQPPAGTNDRKPVPEEIRVPLSAFDVDLHHLAAVELRFGGLTPHGSIQLLELMSRKRARSPRVTKPTPAARNRRPGSSCASEWANIAKRLLPLGSREVVAVGDGSPLALKDLYAPEEFHADRELVRLGVPEERHPGVAQARPRRTVADRDVADEYPRGHRGRKTYRLCESDGDGGRIGPRLLEPRHPAKRSAAHSYRSPLLKENPVAAKAELSVGRNAGRLSYPCGGCQRLTGATKWGYVDRHG